MPASDVQKTKWWFGIKDSTKTLNSSIGMIALWENPPFSDFTTSGGNEWQFSPPYDNTNAGETMQRPVGTLYSFGAAIYPQYADQATGSSPPWYTNIQNLAKQMWVSYGQSIGYSRIPAMGSPGCSKVITASNNNNCGISNKISDWDTSSGGIGLEMLNATAGQPYGTGEVRWPVVTSYYVGFSNNSITSGINRFLTNDLGHNYSTTLQTSWVAGDSHNILNYSIDTWTNGDKYLLNERYRVSGATITNGYSVLSLNKEVGGNPYVVKLNATAYDFRWRELPYTIGGVSTPSQWLNVVVWYSTNQFNGTEVTWPATGYGGNDTIAPYFYKFGSQTSVSSGTHAIRMWIWPTFVNITSVTQITAKTGSVPTLKAMSVAYYEPLSNASRPFHTAIAAVENVQQGLMPTIVTKAGLTWTLRVLATKAQTTFYVLWNKTLSGGTLASVAGATLNGETILNSQLDNVSLALSMPPGTTASIVFTVATGTTHTLTQPIKVTMANSAPSTAVTVNNCSPSPSTFLSDGLVHDVVMSSSCTFALAFSNSASVQYGFNVVNAFSATSPPRTSSATELDITAYEQTQNTASVQANAQTNFDSGLTCVVIGTSVGISSATLATMNTAAVSSVSGTYWSDYGTPVSFCASMAAAPSNSRWQAAGAIFFTDTSGGNTHAVQYWKQLKNTYQASPTSNANHWDAALFIIVAGQQLGSTAQAGCVISTSTGGAATSCSSFFDYGTPVTVNAVAVSATEQWTQAGGNTFTQATGGNSDNVNYLRQWQITMASAPTTCGGSTPGTGSVWETDGAVFAISATPASGCSFSGWSATAGISIGDVNLASTTAVATAAGTIILTFSSA
jgi:hypothetical protein